MEFVWIKLLNMSIAASWLILAVILLRFVLQKAPNSIRYMLWGLVGIRLVCPFSLESMLSLIPSAETISPNLLDSKTPTINSGLDIVNTAVNPLMIESLTPEVTASATPLQIILYVASVIWMLGMAVMLLYSVISYVRLRRKLITAVRLRDNIWQSEAVFSPFVLGLFRPRIYIPFYTDQNARYVILHEATHIRRHDHWIKPLGFLILTIYWFNPLIWLSYILLCRDIELACDERVIQSLGTDEKKAYSSALLEYSVRRSFVKACPLAFGEVGVKQRVKYILNYKKPAVWIVIAALLSCIIVALCFLTNPPDSKPAQSSIGFVEQDASGKQIEGYGHTALRMGGYEANEVVSFAAWSSSFPEPVGTEFVVSSDQFQVNAADETNTAFVENVLYETPQYLTADVGDTIEIMGSKSENTFDPLTLDVSSYSERICYQVLASDGTDTGYRIFHMDHETWIGHWDWYGTYKTGWWCEYIFKVNPVAGTPKQTP